MTTRKTIVLTIQKDRDKSLNSCEHSTSWIQIILNKLLRNQYCQRSHLHGLKENVIETKNDNRDPAFTAGSQNCYGLTLLYTILILYKWEYFFFKFYFIFKLYIVDYLLQLSFYCSTISYVSCMYRGFPGRSVVKNLPAMLETWVPSLAQEGPLE